MSFQIQGVSTVKLEMKRENVFENHQIRHYVWAILMEQFALEMMKLRNIVNMKVNRSAVSVIDISVFSTMKIICMPFI